MELVCILQSFWNSVLVKGGERSCEQAERRRSRVHHLRVWCVRGMCTASTL